MNGDSIYCLMTSGLGLTDHLRGILFGAAQSLLLERKTRRRIRGRNFEGSVVTTFETALMGSVVGVMFSAQVDVGGQSGKVDYLVRPCDVMPEDGSWCSLDELFPVGPSMN